MTTRLGASLLLLVLLAAPARADVLVVDLMISRYSMLMGGIELDPPVIYYSTARQRLTESTTTGINRHILGVVCVPVAGGWFEGGAVVYAAVRESEADHPISASFVTAHALTLRVRPENSSTYNVEILFRGVTYAADAVHAIKQATAIPSKLAYLVPSGAPLRVWTQGHITAPLSTFDRSAYNTEWHDFTESYMQQVAVGMGALASGDAQMRTVLRVEHHLIGEGGGGGSGGVTVETAPIVEALYDLEHNRSAGEWLRLIHEALGEVSTGGSTVFENPPEFGGGDGGAGGGGGGDGGAIPDTMSGIPDAWSGSGDGPSLPGGMPGAPSEADLGQAVAAQGFPVPALMAPGPNMPVGWQALPAQEFRADFGWAQPAKPYWFAAVNLLVGLWAFRALALEVTK